MGITGPSHAVICNLIDKVYERADARGAAPRIGQRADKDNPHLHPGPTSLGPPTWSKASAAATLT